MQRYLLKFCSICRHIHPLFVSFLQREVIKFCGKDPSNRAELLEKVRKIIGIDANFTTRNIN